MKSLRAHRYTFDEYQSLEFVLSEGEHSGGCNLPGHRDRVLRRVRGDDQAVRTLVKVQNPMEGLYLLGAAVSALLFVYLTIALLKPEWFS